MKQKVEPVWCYKPSIESGIQNLLTDSAITKKLLFLHDVTRILRNLLKNTKLLSGPPKKRI